MTIYAGEVVRERGHCTAIENARLFGYECDKFSEYSMFLLQMRR